jgi:hypothetical protein
LKNNLSGDTVAERMGQNVLLNLPKDAVLYGEGDYFTFPLAYFQSVSSVRKDVTVFDRTGGLFQNLYHVLDHDPPLALHAPDRVRIERQWESQQPERPLYYVEAMNAPDRHVSIDGLLYRVTTKDAAVVTPCGLWTSFREPVMGPGGKYSSRTMASRYYFFRAVHGIRNGGTREWIIRDLKRVNELGFDNAILVNAISVELMENGWLESARYGFLHTLEIDPYFYQGWYNLGVVASRSDQMSEVGDDFRRCLAINPNDQLARDGLTKLQNESKP